MTSPNPVPEQGRLTLDERAAIVRSVPAVSQGRSVLVVRVRKDGSNCDASGTVRLAPVVGGRVETSRAVNAGHRHFELSEQGAASVGRQMGSLAKLDFAGFNKELSMEYMRNSFVAIAPGDYRVVHAQCAFRSQRRVSIGGGYSGGMGWIPPGLGASVAVRGDNFIRVPPAKIIDAGLLEIKTTEAGTWLSSGKGTLIGQELSPSVKRQLREEYPEIYSQAQFSRFSGSPGQEP